MDQKKGYTRARRVKSALLAAVLLTTLGVTGCQRENGGEAGGEYTADKTDASKTSSYQQDASTAEGTTSETTADNSDASKTPGYQLEMPTAGEEIAVLHTSMGDIRIRLFPEAAPKAVENFKGLINKGYYDGITFHRVINDFMIQGGDPTATGAGGESIWGKDFEDEFDKNLLNLRGALSMANAGSDTNGSQFFIVQNDADAFSGWEEYETYKAAYKAQMGYDVDAVPQQVRDLYTKHGGAPYLDGGYRVDDAGHTVFGQVFDGMKVVDAIAAVSVNADNKPLQDVVINSAEIVTYQG